MSNMKFTAAVCQMQTELDRKINIEKAEYMVSEAASEGAEVICLPEMWSCPYSKEYFRPFARMGHRDIAEAMSSWAKKLGIVLIGGSIPETEEDRIYNTCFVFDESGRQIARHRKIHLFDVDIPGMRFAESHTFSPGKDITVFDTKFGRMGCAVCFDVRFPELFRSMARRGAEVIILPAQFNTATGPAHWETTLRSRAVDNEVFFIGASAARSPGFSYECWGHSMILDPFSSIIASADETEQTIFAEIDLNRVDEVRKSLPTFLHLREDIYTISN